MKTHKYARKPFYVDAARVTAENINEMAAWCQGEVMTDNEDESPTYGQLYIEVKVHRPLNPRQTRAYIGDWVLFAGSGFKVYTPKAFEKSFEKVKTLTKEQADEAGIKVPHEPRQKPQKKGTPRALTQKLGGAADMERLKEAVTEAPKQVVEKVKSEKDEADKLIDEVLNKG